MQAYGLGIADCHTSDVGHWLAMTGFFTWSAVQDRAAGHMGPALQDILQNRARVPCRVGAVVTGWRGVGSPPYA